ncbi:ATP-binding protein [Aquabacter sp. L1I39]|uniref:ATP-binding protein n=1 Tax=Aquabacter sp. L1I39 TaxID=2820278 RepID=UPI001ADB60A0|nr:ATP-binding protein [Aquabacter sp. L1I39]QTL04514.1 ATP-binding protein [Aquabacter sp. L1I39]
MTASGSQPSSDTLPITADVDEIPRVSEWLDTLSERDELPPGLLFGVQLSIEEALANVINHGFPGGRQRAVIRLEYQKLDDHRFQVRIVDNGVAFDPTAVVSPDMAESVEDAKIGGHGVRLMRHFLEAIRYERKGDENHLLLVAGPKAE